MSRRLLDLDPITGVATYHHYDELTNKTIIETVQDMEPFLDYNKGLQNLAGYKENGIKQDFLHVARIPIAIQEKWLREGIDIYNKDHWPKVKSKLNDPDWKYLRTTLGRV